MCSLQIAIFKQNTPFEIEKCCGGGEEDFWRRWLLKRGIRGKEKEAGETVGAVIEGRIFCCAWRAVVALLQEGGDDKQAVLEACACAAAEVGHRGRAERRHWINSRLGMRSLSRWRTHRTTWPPSARSLRRDGTTQVELSRSRTCNSSYASTGRQLHQRRRCRLPRRCRLQRRRVEL